MAETYFDYRLQVWIVNGRVKVCGHTSAMRQRSVVCCTAWALQGMTPNEASGRMPIRG